MSPYQYTECGLDNVFIEGLKPVTDADGDEVITVYAINILHARIAEGIVRHQKSISGKELRFLRTEMGYTQSKMAELLHCKPLTVGRWEREECQIDGTAETVIRMLAIEKLSIDYSVETQALAESFELGDQVQPINIQASNSEYTLLAA